MRLSIFLHRTLRCWASASLIIALLVLLSVPLPQDHAVAQNGEDGDTATFSKSPRYAVIIDLIGIAGASEDLSKVKPPADSGLLLDPRPYFGYSLGIGFRREPLSVRLTMDHVFQLARSRGGDVPLSNTAWAISTAATAGVRLPSLARVVAVEPLIGYGTTLERFFIYQNRKRVYKLAPDRSGWLYGSIVEVGQLKVAYLRAIYTQSFSRLEEERLAVELVVLSTEPWFRSMDPPGWGSFKLGMKFTWRDDGRRERMGYLGLTLARAW